MDSVAIMAELKKGHNFAIVLLGPTGKKNMGPLIFQAVL